MPLATASVVGPDDVEAEDMTAAEENPADAVVWMIRGQWVTLSVRAAVELGIFDRAGEPTTVGDLAAAASCDPGALVRLVRVMVDLGLVEVVGATAGATVGVGNLVSVTPRGAVLARGHRSGLRDLLLTQTVLPNLASWQRLADAVRTGSSVYEVVNGVGQWEFLNANPELGASFDAAMARRGSDQAAALIGSCDLSGVGTIVDVGGGRGAMLAEVLRVTPGLRGVVADRPAVAAAAQVFLAEVGLADRATAVATDFFAEVPSGGDRYVIANVLHDWADTDAVRILKTIRSAMDSTACLWVVERILDAPDRPFEALRDLHLVDLHMLVMFGARERTVAEYDALLRAAGFTARLVRTDRTWDLIEARPN